MNCLSGLLLHATALAACGAGQLLDDELLPASGMAGCWRFEGEVAPNAEGGVRDHSPQGRHATLRPGAVTGSNGELGGGLVLEGDGGCAGAPGTTRGAVQRQASGGLVKGLTETGPSDCGLATRCSRTRPPPLTIRSLQLGWEAIGISGMVQLLSGSDREPKRLLRVLAPFFAVVVESDLGCVANQFR